MTKRLNTKSCVWCGYSNEIKLSFFEFPKSELRRKEWLEKCKLDASSLTPKATICEKHFTDDAFRCKTNGHDVDAKPSSRKRLKIDAVPTIFYERTNSSAEAANQPSMFPIRNFHSCFICGQNKKEKLSYFRFPANEELRQKWKTHFKIPTSKDVSGARMCSRHFIVENKKIVGYSDYIFDDHAAMVENTENQDTVANTGHKIKRRAKVTFNRFLSCCICGVNKGKNELSYFMFPKCEKRRSDWILACHNYIEWDMDATKAKLCSKHFQPHDFSKNTRKEGGRLTLRKDAVPTIFNGFMTEKTCTPISTSSTAAVGSGKIRESVPKRNGEHLCTPQHQSTHKTLVSLQSESTPDFSICKRSCDFVPRYPGDIFTPQIDTSRGSQNEVQVLKKFIQKQQNKINTLQQQLRQARREVAKCLQSMTDLQRQSRSMTDPQRQSHLIDRKTRSKLTTPSQNLHNLLVNLEMIIRGNETNMYL